MTSSFLRLLAFLVVIHSPSFGQKLKKADRAIVTNIQAHIAFLNGENLKGRVAGSDGEKLAGEYIIKQFIRSGLKPKGTTNTWYQGFEIYDGKESSPETQLAINTHPLKLDSDYFPFSFSANKRVNDAVAVALAENGVPWFKDLKEILEDHADGTPIDTLEMIRIKAQRAAKKGATAFFVYNTTDKEDLSFDKYNKSPTVTIPVIYIKKAAYKKYFSDESAILDIAANISLETKKRTGNNLIGYTDNGADSTIVINAHLDKEIDAAAMIEIARLLKGTQKKNKNYLFIIYSGEQHGEYGKNYFLQHATLSLRTVKSTLDLDTVQVDNENPKGLNLVKRSIEIIKNN